jgi:hypothetical protein
MQHVDVELDRLPPLRPRGPSFSARWRALPQAVRAPAWPVALAGGMILALLLGFHHVVREAVHQGELLRLSVANRAEAVWRCNALPRAAVRASCLAQIDAPPRPRGESGPPPNTVALSLAGTGS